MFFAFGTSALVLFMELGFEGGRDRGRVIEYCLYWFFGSFTSCAALVISGEGGKDGDNLVKYVGVDYWRKWILIVSRGKKVMRW